MKIVQRTYKVFYKGAHYDFSLCTVTKVKQREKVLVRSKLNAKR